MRGDDPYSAVASSRPGRVVIGIVVVVMAAWIIGPNLPGGPARRQLDTLWAPATNVGLVQDWGVFSPDPRNQSIDVRAVIDYADGTSTVWDLPDYDPFIGAYRQYRWQKWQERVREDARDELWEPTAQWLADEHRVDGEQPVRVTLIRRWIDHEPLTESGTVDSGWNEYTFYTWTPDTVVAER